MTDPDREPLVLERRDGAVARLELNDPAKRNAMSVAMFDALDAALARADDDDGIVAILLHGRGRAFCAGFDLAAADRDPGLLEAYILRLSATIRAVRRAAPVVIAAVHGAAIAGGCALISACDLVVAAPDAKIGYPVHRLGLSPAVSLATLLPAIGPGPARRLQIGGELIDGIRAFEMGLVHRLAASAGEALSDAEALARTIASHGRGALRATKAWLNELDGSLEERRFDGPAADTAAQARGEETAALLRSFWKSKRTRN